MLFRSTAEGHEEGLRYVEAGTPSRLPARAPLSSLQQGQISPVRRAQSDARAGDLRASVREGREPPPNSREGLMMGPASRVDRAPPPKMRELFEAPEDTPTPVGHYRGNSINEQYRNPNAAHLYRSQSVESNPHSVVRAVAPEDVYDDRDEGNKTIRGLGRAFERPYSDTSSSSHNSSTRQYGDYPQPPAIVRQTSHTSTAATSVVSGSENWETYDSDPEEEPERSDEYHKRLAIARQQQGMRNTPEGYPPRQLAGSALERTRSPPVHRSGSVLGQGRSGSVMGGSVRGFPPQRKEAIRPVPTFDERGERIFSNDTNWTDSTDNF